MADSFHIPPFSFFQTLLSLCYYRSLPVGACTPAKLTIGTLYCHFKDVQMTPISGIYFTIISFTQGSLSERACQPFQKNIVLTVSKFENKKYSHTKIKKTAKLSLEKISRENLRICFK